MGLNPVKPSMKPPQPQRSEATTSEAWRRSEVPSSLVTTYTTVWLVVVVIVIILSMSRTHRQPTYWKYPHRHPRTFNELKQVQVTNDYYDSQYTVSTRKRNIPTAWDDQVISAIYEQDYKR
jgi:hypothetical protein